MHGVAFKKRAPRAIKEIRGFAVKAMVCDKNMLWLESYVFRKVTDILSF